MAHMEGDMLRDDWHLEDVHSCVEGLTDEQAHAVLTHVAETFDATLGINWDSFIYAAQALGYTD